MIPNIITFILVFALGEVISHFTLFAHLKRYFNVTDENTNKIFGLDISVFKGVQERFVLYFALCIDISQILIVYGALKIGTRFDKNDKIKNDYFLIGNFASIFLAIFDLYLYNKITTSILPKLLDVTGMA
jgi:hypothetical protein